MTEQQLPFALTADEQAELDRMLAELHEHGYTDVERHVYRTGVELVPGTRIRHAGDRFWQAIMGGTGYVVAITEKPESSWSRTYGMPDVELVALFDRSSFRSGLAVLAQYHVAVIGGEGR